MLARKVKEKEKVRPGIWDGDCQECKDKTDRLPINLLAQPLRLVSIVIKLLCTNDALYSIMETAPFSSKEKLGSESKYVYTTRVANVTDALRDLFAIILSIIYKIWRTTYDI